MTCKDCIWHSRCALERRGPCVEFRERGHPVENKVNRGGVNEQIRNREQGKN